MGLQNFKNRLQAAAERVGQSLETDLSHHFESLHKVRWFVFGWVGLVVIMLIGLTVQTLSLSTYYQTLRTVPGGIYNEGIVGQFTNANPLYATNDVDTSVSRLIFSGLLKYDNSGNLVGDLASDYVASDNGSVYTVHLRPNLTWQDGKPLTSDDVLFTYDLIQNPDTASPLESSWQGIKITAPDARTIVFKLPGTLASFPYNLTNGIVPKHLLASIPPTDLRSANFNSLHPIGSGPFSWQTIQISGANTSNNSAGTQYQIALKPFNNYAGGKPKLQQFNVRTYSSQDELSKAFKGGQLNGAQGFDSVPEYVAKSKSDTAYSITLRAATMVFFKTTDGVLTDATVRHSLVQATNTPAIIKDLGYNPPAVNEPLLTGQLGYDPASVQPSFDLNAAKTALTSDGWTTGSNGERTKNGQPLTFTLSAADTPDDHTVGTQLQKQWQAAGAKLTVQYLDAVDFQNAVSYHDYDALLDGISIGVDPDVFVYWDSSQADVRSTNRLNFSEYDSSVADASLEGGRSRLSPAERIIKYKPFLQAWQQDSPAVGLYQPRELYITYGTLTGLSKSTINSAADRYANVQNWEIRQARVTN